MERAARRYVASARLYPTSPSRACPSGEADELPLAIAPSRGARALDASAEISRPRVRGQSWGAENPLQLSGLPSILSGLVSRALALLLLPLLLRQAGEV
jgi:hypothetical protein